MKPIFDEETNKRLLEAKSRDEIAAIIAETPMADEMAVKIDLVMSEIDRIKNDTDEEMSADELENVAGGAKRKRVNLSETVDCVATFYMHDMRSLRFCGSNDHCAVTNEYDYHYTRWSNCPKGGKHQWRNFHIHWVCLKCDEDIYNADLDKWDFDD
ncbi:MAG: hypothetical protein J6Z43_07345 [Clostridiales bacterium]|nr:hypothetical protein [Clostridiales bacterium]